MPKPHENNVKVAIRSQNLLRTLLTTPRFLIYLPKIAAAPSLILDHKISPSPTSLSSVSH